MFQPPDPSGLPVSFFCPGSESVHSSAFHRGISLAPGPGRKMDISSRWVRRTGGGDPAEKNPAALQVGTRGRPTHIFLSHFALLE